jgi:hypothetical protein
VPPIVGTPGGEKWWGRYAEGWGVLQRDGGATDSSEMAESMIFVAAVLCITQVMDIFADIRYPWVTNMDMIFYP